MGTAGRKQEDPVPERPYTQATKVGCAGEGPASEDIGPQRVHLRGGHEPNSKGSTVCSERFMAACSEELKHRPVFQQRRVGLGWREEVSSSEKTVLGEGAYRPGKTTYVSAH